MICQRCASESRSLTLDWPPSRRRMHHVAASSKAQTLSRHHPRPETVPKLEKTVPKLDSAHDWGNRAVVSDIVGVDVLCRDWPSTRASVHPCGYWSRGQRSRQGAVAETINGAGEILVHVRFGVVDVAGKEVSMSLFCGEIVEAVVERHMQTASVVGRDGGHGVKFVVDRSSKL
ncbi:hypothetical protein CALCODRAFT_119086 [Calocera cornea HHB12733]|uniref:Uncharacterized protein n=1 Tax=Calocera cornea HHB12733 TaxID=1353952 RepID=A0A165IE01_9BASI|nr:hypothetical protein CALCODRAFT_119086 [Calocera cornea HHB12733]